MKILSAIILCCALSACAVGAFSPERHAQYESPVNCEETPNRCINGYPW